MSDTAPIAAPLAAPLASAPANSSAAATPTSGIGQDTSRLGSRANLEKAGKQFESVFVGMMLKSMRQAKLGTDLFENKGTETFRDMQDQKTAAAIAEHAPLGIGKAMVDFLAKAQANQAAGDAAGKTTP